MVQIIFTGRSIAVVASLLTGLSLNWLIHSIDQLVQFILKQNLQILRIFAAQGKWNNPTLTQAILSLKII